MNVLITGGTGLLGYALQHNHPPNLKAATIYHPDEHPLPYKPPFPSQPLDITDSQTLIQLWKEFKPDVVIHTAAQGSVDWCEEHQEEAYAINVTGTNHIIDLCQNHHAHFIFISSNAVYDGHRGLYNELDQTDPVNFYGTTKVLVENSLKQRQLSYTILRPNLMYGWPAPGGRDNQVTRVLNSLKSTTPINVVNDTFFSPLPASFMSDVIWRAALNKITGIYNVGGADRMNLYELSVLAANIFKLDSTLIKPISHLDTNASAARAIDTSFDSSLMQKTFSLSPITVSNGLNDIKTSH